MNKKKDSIYFFVVLTVSSILSIAMIWGFLSFFKIMMQQSFKNQVAPIKNIESIYKNNRTALQQSADELLKNDGLVMVTTMQSFTNQQKGNDTFIEVDGVWVIYKTGSRYTDITAITSSETYQLVKSGIFKEITSGISDDGQGMLTYIYSKSGGIEEGLYRMNGNIAPTPLNNASMVTQIYDEWYWFDMNLNIVY